MERQLKDSMREFSRKFANHQSIYRGKCITLVQICDFMTQVIDAVQNFKRDFDTSNEKGLLRRVEADHPRSEADTTI